MKFYLFLIQLIIYSQVFTHEEKLKKNKEKGIIEHYFKKRLKYKNKGQYGNNKNNLIIKGDSDDLSYDFNYWESFQYNNLRIDKKKKDNINYEKNENIDYITQELNVVMGNYQTNNLLNNFNNRKFKEYEEPIEHIKLYELNTDNLPNNNEEKYDDLIQKNRMHNRYKNPNYQYQSNGYHYDNNFPNQETINRINNINNINYMNQMNNHHRNPGGFAHNYNTGQMGGKSSYYESHQGSHQSTPQHSNYQTYSNNSKKSKMGGYFSGFYQIMMVVGFVGLIYRLLLGNRKNDKYTMGWYESNIDYLKERYELVGLVEDEITGTYKKPDEDIITKSLMIKESTDNYKLICGNYRYIKYLIINLYFQKKYDMNFFLTSFFMVTRDKITYQVTFNSVDPCGWAFCFAKTRQAKGIKKGYEDLNSFCEVYRPNFMSEDMCLICEDLETFKEMFNNKKLLDYYRRAEYYIDNIYYSDTINSYFEENNIYFTFDIDLNESYQDRTYLEITHFVNLFVDSLAQIKFTDELKQKFKNKRDAYRENKIREDMKDEIEEREKKEFIEQFKIKTQMKGKKGFERKKLEKKLKKRNHK